MKKRTRQQPKPAAWHRRFENSAGEFKCTHCQALVSTSSLRSGVNNRNHCPFCLWSKHVDLNSAGDRLADCQSAMQPVGLTVKRIFKKYGNNQGELMLIHRCEGCGKVSLNRIAADDDPYQLVQVFESSQSIEPQEKAQLGAAGIDLLGAAEAEIVRTQLFGKALGQ